MKKILLASTAVLAAGLFSQAASAQMTVTTGGYLEFTAGFFDNDEFVADSADRDFEQEAEIVVKAAGKADMGLDYSAEIQINNDSGAEGVVVDEAFITLAGSWGKVEMGDADGAADVMAVYAPIAGVGYEGIDGDYTDVIGQAHTGVKATDTDDATKITYYTPVYAGFQAGVTYAPQADSEGQDMVSEASANYKDAIEAAISYSHDFGVVGLKTAATLVTADGKDADLEDFTAYQVGAQLTYGAFTFGGGYVDNDQAGATAGSGDDAGSAYNLGVAYTSGPVVVAASYLDNGKDEVNGLKDYKAYGPTVQYTVAPGLLVQGDLMFVSEKTEAGDKNDGYVLLLGTRVNF